MMQARVLVVVAARLPTAAAAQGTLNMICAPNIEWCEAIATGAQVDLDILAQVGTERWDR
jgi:iron(III) transport system substrate-binding protein